MAGSKRNEIRAAVQQRVKRFSPFELLGLDRGTSPSLSLESEQSDLSSTSTSVRQCDAPPKSHISDRDISDSLTDGPTVPSNLRADSLLYDRTVQSDLASDLHISDCETEPGSDSISDSSIEERSNIPQYSLVSPAASEPIPLAPLQWRVWQALLQTEGRVISHQGLAASVNGSVPGVRQAIQVIEREGGIQYRQTVREKTPDGAILQGFRVSLNHAILFQQISFRESHRLQKRGLLHRHTSDRLIHPQADIADSLRMYVSNKIHTYIPELLRLCPREWQIREQTLMKIAEAFPDMSLLEFRRSIRYLVEQAQTAKHPVQNPNAWLKAAFERNGGPLVTERMIEAQIDQQGTKMNEERVLVSAETDKDLDILRRYVAASVEDKAEIDRMAEERVGRLLGTVSADKHAGIREQARIECAREFFAERGK
jgi:hypothetical protein